MKCEDQMDGVGLRLGSKRGYLAALSDHLQDSKIKPPPGPPVPGGLTAVSDLSLHSQDNESPHVWWGRLQSSCLSVLVQ